MLARAYAVELGLAQVSEDDELPAQSRSVEPAFLKTETITVSVPARS